MSIAVFLDVVQHGLVALYLDICPKVRGNTYQKPVIFFQNNWSPGHDLSLGPPEYKALVLTTQLCCLLVWNINATGTLKGRVNVYSMSHVQMLPLHSVDKTF